MKKKSPSKEKPKKRVQPQEPNKPEKKWDTLKDSESLAEKQPPVKRSGM